ncbi:DNA-binding response regulator [Cellvibrio sp. KY-GH-1]|uniref:response regulator n=1 Tax=Cellvibrio sp. KY-GH-1 TaxID=2303332 RepID=UPI00124407FB|nr:response regulator transcription factor [Cellvibrio sp. KY-GH-1]QEY17694.1 DNA-binding response regulator [Cellvibrio sp. KY-GH-1]
MLDIGLVDDQQLVRQGIAGLLAISGHARVLWEARNGEEALTLIAQQPVNALLADIRMPEMDGIALVKRLRAQKNSTPVLMLTTFDDAELFSQSLIAGANGFLLKDISLEKLISSLQAIVTGSTFLAEPELLREHHQKKSTLELSERELQILRLLVGGFSNKEIASAIFLAEGTVRNHISNLLAKLDCRDRTQAVLKAINTGLV